MITKHENDIHTLKGMIIGMKIMREIFDIDVTNDKTTVVIGSVVMTFYPNINLAAVMDEVKNFMITHPTTTEVSQC